MVEKFKKFYEESLFKYDFVLIEKYRFRIIYVFMILKFFGCFYCWYLDMFGIFFFFYFEFNL